LLLVDARHPGLENDRTAWRWLDTRVGTSAIVATKIDKLPRGQRIRAMSELQSVFDEPVLPVSATTGEGLDELWRLIDKLARLAKPSRHKSSRPGETERRLPTSPKS
jgi:GTP-binding protein